MVKSLISISVDDAHGRVFVHFLRENEHTVCDYTFFFVLFVRGTGMGYLELSYNINAFIILKWTFPQISGATGKRNILVQL